MKKIISIVALVLFIGCNKNAKTSYVKNEKVEFNQALADTLSKMTEKDQYYAGIPKGKYEGNWEAWYAVRDSSVRVHKKILEKIMKEYGYPGYDLIGKEGESNFWVMVQHSDFDPDFQAEVLVLLKEQIDKKNASGSHYGLLTDRVRKNTNKPQLFGTQVSYNKFGQAYIESLEDSASVNQRRKKFDMEPLQEYLNGMTEMHFRMNKEHLIKEGVMEPKLYPIPKE